MEYNSGKFVREKRGLLSNRRVSGQRRCKRKRMRKKETRGGRAKSRDGLVRKEDTIGRKR